MSEDEEKEDRRKKKEKGRTTNGGFISLSYCYNGQATIAKNKNTLGLISPILICKEKCSPSLFSDNVFLLVCKFL